MNRDFNLQELSRDHHYGLLLGWKIRQGLKKLVKEEEIYNYVRHFFSIHLLSHFKLEEELVFSHLSDEDSMKQKALEDHKLIEQLIADKQLPIPSNRLHHIAEVLDEHIRFEERILFPHLQTKLSQSELAELGESVRAAHKPFEDSYPNEFWK